MAIAVTYNLNRVVQATATPTDFLLSHVAVDLKIDPSQQFRIHGLEAGYYLSDADQTAFLFGNIHGFLDIQRNPNEGSIFYDKLLSPNFGDLIFAYQITSVNDTWTHIDFARPMIIEGNRRVTFILSRPVQTIAAPTGDCGISLLVRGEVTQIERQEKQRLGQWEPR